MIATFSFFKSFVQLFILAPNTENFKMHINIFAPTEYVVQKLEHIPLKTIV